MWAWQMRKLDACTSHHREVRDRAQSAHGAKIFPSAGITEAQDYRCAAFDELSFPGSDKISAAQEIAEPLCLRWIALEAWQFVRAFHTVQPLGGLDMHHRRDGIGVVVGRALNVDDAGQDVRIDVEEPRSAVGAEVAAAMLR